MGGFYLDIIKDRQYTMAKTAKRGVRANRMYYIAEAMVRWIAPILSFTAEKSGGICPPVPLRRKTCAIGIFGKLVRNSGS